MKKHLYSEIKLTVKYNGVVTKEIRFGLFGMNERRNVYGKDKCKNNQNNR